MDKLDNLITLREASKISGYNSDYLGYLIREGKMNGRKVGRNWMTTAEDVKYYLTNLAALSKINKKPVNFKVAVLVMFVSALATFGVYYVYTVIYQNAYDQVANKSASTTVGVNTGVEKTLQ